MNLLQRLVRSTAPLLCIFMLIAAPAAAQENDEDPPPRKSKTPIPQDGFWPTRLMMQRAFERVN